MREKLIFTTVLVWLSCQFVFAQKIGISLASGKETVNEKCGLLNNDQLVFTLDSVARQNTRFVINLSGTATRGTDFATNLTDTILFTTGQQSRSFDLTVFGDAFEESEETVVVIATGQDGFADTFRITIQDHIARILTSQDTFRQCCNEPFKLNLYRAAGSVINWFPADMVAPTDDPNIFTILPIRTSPVILTATIDNCVERDTIQVISQPIGVTLNTKDTLFLCFPDSFRLVATRTPANAQIIWSPLDSTTRVINATSIQVKPPKSARYFVNVTSGVCKAADTVYVSMDSLRDTKITHFPKKDKYCPGDSIFFFSQRHPKDLFPALKVMWNPSNGFQTPSDTFNAVVSADKTTTYLRITENNACVHRDSVYIKVVEPTIPVGPVDTTVCPGETVQINFNQDSSVYEDFKWSPQDGLISCEKCDNPKILVLGQQQYMVEAKKDGCDATAMISTNVFQKPQVGVFTNIPQPIPAGSNVQFLLQLPSGTKAFKWSVDRNAVPSGNLTTTVNNMGPGVHEVDVEITDANGCMWAYQFLIEVLCPPNSLTLQRSPQGTIYERSTLQINATGINSNVTNIRWSINGSNVNENGLTLTHKPTTAGNYTYRFEAIDLNGCPLAASIIVEVKSCISPEELKKKIPNAFTPNNDEINDFFNYSDGTLTITKILVFSRWGQLVYNNTDPENGWDGRINSNEAASDVYIYRLTYICGDAAPQEVSGTVTLLR